MRKETPENSLVVSLEELANPTEQECEQNWQNLGFTKSFSIIVFTLVSLEEKTRLLDDEQKSAFQRHFTTFMSLPWTLNDPKAVAGTAVVVDENLRAVRPRSSKDGSKLPTESLHRVNIGALILWGKSLKDKEYINTIMSESYQQFSDNKKTNFRSHVLRLVTKDSLFRNLVKRDNLDDQNGFEWNREVTKLWLFSLRYRRNVLPVEFSDSLKNFPLETLDEFVNYYLDYIDKYPGKGDTQGFKMRLKELPDGYFDNSPLSLKVQEKINDLIGSKPT